MFNLSGSKFANFPNVFRRELAEDGYLLIEPDGLMFKSFSARHWRLASFLARKDDVVYVPLIHARHRGRGAFRKLVEDIHGEDLVVAVIAPLGDTQAILTHWGSQPQRRLICGTVTDVWELPPTASQQMMKATMPDLKPDPISVEPTLVGRHGRAWRLDLSKQRADKTELDAAVDLWVVEAPWAHPAWHSYGVVLIHLRPVEGEDTVFYLAGASHEVVIYALDPREHRQAMVDEGRIAPLEPPNFAAQFIEPDDAKAQHRIQVTVQSIIDGLLSPDTDFVRLWVQLFGDNMIQREENTDGNDHACDGQS